MEPTLYGLNRTGLTAGAKRQQAMQEAVHTLSPPTEINTREAESKRFAYLMDSPSLGSVSPPVSLSGRLKSGVARALGRRPELLVDKLAERIAFERCGVRLYDALIVKHKAAAAAAAGPVLPPIAQALRCMSEPMELPLTLRDEHPPQTLARIRAEEVSHLQLLWRAMQQIGGDPVAQTPCADVAGTASAGLIQVVTDPRTTLAQSLQALLIAELTDNAGWELLIELSDKAGESQLCEPFEEALAQESLHLLIIRAWHTALLTVEGTPGTV